TCKACHKVQFTAWKKSHHSWALRHAKPENVLGSFDNTVHQRNGVRTTFRRDQDRFYIDTTTPDGLQKTFEILYTVGVEPLQQYLIELDGGRLQALDIAWDTNKKRWFHLYPDQNVQSNDGLHWSGPYKNWNARCAECHQTNFKKGYSHRRKTYDSTWSELTVGCQSCHGPAGAHLAWANEPESFDQESWTDVDSIGLRPSFLSKSGATKSDVSDSAVTTTAIGVSGKGSAATIAEINVCGKCHSRRSQFGADSPPVSGPFHDHYRLALLRDGLYYPDGQINDEVYVLGSFLQSKMHARGVTCSNCHDPHSGKVIAQGNAVCTQCHNPSGRSEFPSLPKKAYDTHAHHFHNLGGPGAQCVACHMPEKSYMIVDPRRDHSFRVPRPDLTIKIRSPNACNQCHTEKTPQWAAEAVKAWYPDGRSKTQHFGEHFHAHRVHSTEKTRKPLLAIAADTQRPAIVRASALSELRGARSKTEIAAVVELLDSENALVRAAAVRALQGASQSLKIQKLFPKLADPMRVVRMAAVRATMNLPLTDGLGSQKEAIGKARQEFRRMLGALSDFPETHLQIGGLALTSRNLRAADAAFAEAVRQDPQLIDAWLMRGRIALARRRLNDAISILRSAADANPQSSPILHSLGQAYIRARRFADAIPPLKRALMQPEPIRGLRLDLARAYAASGNLEAAIDVLTATVGTTAETVMHLDLLANLHARLGNRAAGSEIARRLIEKYPAHPLSAQLRMLLQTQ
ncbi:MAG: tetratricopeptide repeat protein, partial [Hyphomicrobiaceae bacterium]